MSDIKRINIHGENFVFRDNSKIYLPAENPNGTSGQLLRTNGDGTTAWVDEGLPTNEQTAEAVAGWLENHPEATTTVEDGSITYAKLDSNLKAKADDVSDLKSVISDIEATTMIIIPSVQLFDRSKVTVGRMDLDGTINTTATGYRYTEKISVVGHTGDTIYFSNDNVTREASRVTAFVGESADATLGASSASAYIVPETVTDIVISYDSTRTHFQAQYNEKTDYVPYGDTYIQKTDKTLSVENVAADAKTVGDEIGTLQEDVDWIVQTEYSPNLCNEADNVQGLMGSNGAISTTGGDANYKTSDYIEMEGNTNYTISVWDKTGATPVTGRIRTLLFDASKNVVSNTYTNETGISYKTISNVSAKYIRFSYYYGSAGGSERRKCMFVKGTDHSEYVEYYVHKTLNNDIYFNETQRKEVPFAASELNGKKWAPCGDSFTYGSESATFDDGLYAGKNKVYPYFIGNRTGMKILDTFFYSGRTLAYPSDGTFTNSLCCSTAACYYQNIPDDVDYITIYLGINDNHHEQGTEGGDGEDVTGVITLYPLDEHGDPITDPAVYMVTTDTSCYYGAWNTVLTWLRTNRPFAHIGIIVTNGAPQGYREAQIAMAKKYGVPYIDMNGDDITPVMLRSCNADIPEAIRNTITANQRVSASNSHPNDDAHEFESWFIEDFLKRL